MESLFFYLNLSALVCGVGSLVFGITQMVRHKYGMYYNIALLSLGTMTLGFLFRLIFLISTDNTYPFSLSFLAMTGSNLFFLTANRSYISVLEDAPTKHKRKATLISLIFPIVFAVLLVLIFLKRGLVLLMIPLVLLTFASGFCTFFSFRQLLLPDIKKGFIDCMRPYNGMVCLLSSCCMAMEVMAAYHAPAFSFVLLGVIGDAVLVLLTVFLYAGVKKWRT